MSTKQTKKPVKTKSVKFKERVFESDGTYFLKLVVVLLLGTFWIKFQNPITWLGFSIHAIPVGVLLGLLTIRAFEHHQSDRKIWYAVLIVVGVVCSFGPAGIIV